MSNAAFGGAGGAAPPWLPLRPIGVDPAKENRSPNSIKKPLAADDVDAEIEEVQREIARLSNKLHLLLNIKKADTTTPLAKRGVRVVPAKFMNAEAIPPPLQQQKRVVQESPGSRRGGGMSLGPMEISRTANVSSIAAPLRSGTGQRKAVPRKPQGVKEEKGSATTTALRRRGTSIGPAEMFSSSRSQFRRKSGVQEVARGARRSLSSSPKPRRAAAAAAAASKASELLFQEAEDPVEDRRGLAGASSSSSSPSSIMKVAAALRKIRTLRRCGAAESPRDSGCAKRVAELVGRRSFFAADNDGGSGSPSSCQNLNFDDEAFCSDLS